MKTLLSAVVSLLASAAIAQQTSPAPTKPPFAGFGGTALDRRPGSSSTPSPFSRPAPSAAPAASLESSRTAGIALADGWSGHVTQGSGGQTRKMADLLALLSGLGTADADTAPHPDVVVYEGQRADGQPGDNCRITYLMPLRAAEAQLFHGRGIATVSKAVAPGFPDGLYLHTYDVKAGIYNRLCILTDSARPEPQVCGLLLKAEGANWYAPSPFRKLLRDWHTVDYVNTENRGQSDIVIDTRINDRRQNGGYIVVNTTGGPRPEVELPPPGVLFKPAQNSPKETVTWYAPAPLVRLMLYCLSKQLNR